MKKLLLFLALPLLLQSCLFEDENNFDENASARLQERIAETKTAIKAAPGGWILHYFPDLKYGGYNYWFSFDTEKATAAGAVGDSVKFPPTYTEECFYNVIAEQGVVLTFNTYGELVHYFRNPSSAAYQGKLGDYEYIVLDVKSTEIRLRGKTTKNTMRMFPLPSGYTVPQYLKAVADMEELGELGAYFVKHNGTTIGITVGSSGGRCLGLEVEAADGELIDMTIPVVFTHDGFTVYHENLRNNVGLFPTDGSTYYTEFVYDAAGDGSFISKDGKIVFEVKPLTISEKFAVTPGAWWPKDGSADYIAMVAAVRATTNANGNFDKYYIGANSAYPGRPFPMAIFVYGTAGYNAIQGLAFTPVEGVNDQIGFTALGDGLNWSYFTNYNPIVNFFVNNSPWTIEEIDAVTIKLTKVANPTTWIELEL